MGITSWRATVFCQDEVEIDESILSEMDSLGFSRESTVDSLLSGSWDHVTTT